MSEIIDSAWAREGTSVSRFLANRAARVVEETRPVGRVKGEHGDVVSAETMILNVVKGTKKETTYGIRLERSNSNGDFDSAVFIDYDELDELISAIDFISSTATEL